MIINPAWITALWPIAKQLFTKTKTGAKEVSLVGLYFAGIPIYDQFMICGIECVDSSQVGIFVSIAWLLCIRLYTKHKESTDSNVLK